MPQLLNVWPSVRARVAQAPRVLLLSDFDGTLTPIADRPDQAQLSPRTREQLRYLSRQDKYIVGIISGRSLQDVEEKVGVPGLIYAGNHGLEIQGPGIEFLHPEVPPRQAILARINDALQRSLAIYDGVVLENKRLSLSAHYRLVPEDRSSEVEETFLAAVSPFEGSGEIRITRGKKVLEVRPNVSWDKGKAIGKLNEVYPEASLTFFFGDDITDEDGFFVVQERGGVSVFVGPPRQPTRALYRLDSPQEVSEVLALLSQLAD